MNRKVILVLILGIALPWSITARQGMWIPSLLKSLNESDLQAMGLQIPVESLFSTDSSGLNHAIVQFGGGCTGEIVSDRGLLFTNHHCGFNSIQALSSLEHNYLDQGFWAQADSLEIPCPGLTVTFIRDIQDVSQLVTEKLTSISSEEQREKTVKAITDSLEKSFSSNGMKAVVRPFYGGNRYFLFLTETFRDIRFVGAPPTCIGNFGGETDNWMWPRHTGDFSVFRIYADDKNQPADFSRSNRPYRPRRWLTVNSQGCQEGDFTMVYGFPGRTQQFLASESIRLIQEQTNPNRIRLRDIRMEGWRKGMRDNDTIRLQYSAKFRTLANSYKRWKGELIGLQAEDVVNKRMKQESSIHDPEGQRIIKALNQCVDSSRSISAANDFFAEGLSGIELLGIAAKLQPLIDAALSPDTDPKKLEEIRQKSWKECQGFYKNYSPDMDRSVTPDLLRACSDALPATWQPDFLVSFKQKPDETVRWLFSSVLTQPEKLEMLIKNGSVKKLKALSDDPAVQSSQQLTALKTKTIDPDMTRKQSRINTWQRDYIRFLLEQSKSPIAPDANSTLRVSYGKVEGMHPRDGVEYSYYTTADGILEKEATGNEDYALSEEVLLHLKKRDFGPWGQSDTLHVAFLASNHTTGGNSGSPVLNARGELIGINFDRIWEGVMSDIYFNPALSRNVSVDIRYVLYVIDRLGNDRRLLDEMRIPY